MEQVYITITGMNHKYGADFVVPQMVGIMKVYLEKEPNNKHDKEAIVAEVPGLGKIGYVANSTHTVIGDCYSAGRLYDRIGQAAIATVEYKLDNALVCSIDNGSIIS